MYLYGYFRGNISFSKKKKMVWFSQAHIYFCFDLSIKHENVNESVCVEEHTDLESANNSVSIINVTNRTDLKDQIFRTYPICIKSRYLTIIKINTRVSISPIWLDNLSKNCILNVK